MPLGAFLGGELRGQGLLLAGHRREQQFAVQVAIGDEGVVAAELQQHSGGAGLVDLDIVERDLDARVGVGQHLALEVLDLREQPFDLLAERHARQVVRAHAADADRERLRGARARDRPRDEPPGVACELAAVARVLDDVRDGGVQQRRGRLADSEQRVDGGQRDDALPDERLRGFREVEDLQDRRDAGATEPRGLRGSGLRQAVLDHHPAHGPGLRERVGLAAAEVLGGRRGRAAAAADDRVDVRRAEQYERAVARLAAVKLVVVVGVAVDRVHEDGGELALQLDRAGHRGDVVVSDGAGVRTDTDALERNPRDLLAGVVDEVGRGRGGGHGGVSSVVRCGVCAPPKRRGLQGSCRGARVRAGVLRRGWSRCTASQTSGLRERAHASPPGGCRDRRSSGRRADAFLVAAVDVPGRHGACQRVLCRRIADQHSRAGPGRPSVERIVAAAGALAVRERPARALRRPWSSSSTPPPAGARTACSDDVVQAAAVQAGRPRRRRRRSSCQQRTL